MPNISEKGAKTRAAAAANAAAKAAPAAPNNAPAAPNAPNAANGQSIKNVSIRHFKELFDLFKSGNYAGLIKKINVMEEMGMINKELKELISTAIPALIFLKSFKTDDNSYSDNLWAYINKIKYTCYMKQSAIEFNKCAKDTSINLLSIFVEGSFNTIKKFIEDSYDKKHSLYPVSTVIGTFTTEEKKDYTKKLIDNFQKIVNSLMGVESKEKKEGWSLKSVKENILGLLNMSKKIIPAINDNEVTIKFLIDTVFQVIESAITASGSHLLINQFVYAYADNLSNEKSDIYKNIKQHDHLNTLISFIRIAINSLPTLILKYFQIIKKTNFNRKKFTHNNEENYIVIFFYFTIKFVCCV